MLTDETSILHTVSFRLSDDADADAFLERASVLPSIEGVQDFAVLREVSPKNDFTHGFTMRFANQAAYDAYNTHPDHVAFVDEVWARDVADFQEIDWMASGA